MFSKPLNTFDCLSLQGSCNHVLNLSSIFGVARLVTAQRWAPRSLVGAISTIHPSRCQRHLKHSIYTTNIPELMRIMSDFLIKILAIAMIDSFCRNIERINLTYLAIETTPLSLVKTRGRKNSGGYVNEHASRRIKAEAAMKSDTLYEPIDVIYPCKNGDLCTQRFPSDISTAGHASSRDQLFELHGLLPPS